MAPSVFRRLVSAAILFKTRATSILENNYGLGSTKYGGERGSYMEQTHDTPPDREERVTMSNSNRIVSRRDADSAELKKD